MLYLIALLLLIGWFLGVFIFSLKGLVHVALFVAIIIIIIKMIKGEKIL